MVIIPKLGLEQKYDLTGEFQRPLSIFDVPSVQRSWYSPHISGLEKILQQESSVVNGGNGGNRQSPFLNLRDYKLSSLDKQIRPPLSSVTVKLSLSSLLGSPLKLALVQAFTYQSLSSICMTLIDWKSTIPLTSTWLRSSVISKEIPSGSQS